MKYIHEFQNNTEFENYYFGQNYIEPHVSLTVDVNRLDYNKSGKALLRGMPLTFDVLTDGTITLNNGGSVGIYVKYKLNDGDWTEVSTPCTINVVSGDAVQFKSSTGSIGNSSQYHYFGGTATFNVKGNIMSLFNSSSDDFESITSLDNSYTHTFYKLFVNCTGLIDASELLLPATTLVSNCYGSMFNGCTSLTTTPALPATTLAEHCYEYMFVGCTSLTSAPKLPATTLADYCYRYMFGRCTNLSSAPELLATTLVDSCYRSMFYGCTNLTTAPALPATTLAVNCYYDMFDSCDSLTTVPALPATTLTDYCYYKMFQDCTNLTTVPELPATTLAQNCYQQMFYGCKKLNYIKCLATDISASNYTNSWVANVSSTGTFVKATGVTWPTGASGIPSGWTVQDVANE